MDDGFRNRKANLSVRWIRSESESPSQAARDLRSGGLLPPALLFVIYSLVYDGGTTSIRCCWQQRA
jgi:hypothetical protein